MPSEWMEESQRITPRQYRFINSYVVENSAEKAAIAAGYKESNASIQGGRLLKRDNIKAALADRLDCMAAASEITVERILREYGYLAFACVEWYYHEIDGDYVLKPLNEWPVGAGAAVQSFTNDTRGRLTGIKLHPKVVSLDALSKYRGMFTERSEVTVRIEKIERNMHHLATKPLHEALAPGDDE